jgi:fructose-1,6-bisphosphatase-3
MEMKLQGKVYEGKDLMDKMESLCREGYFFEDNTNQKQYGMDMMWYLWNGKCSSLFGKDDMTTFERYFIEEKETHKENKNPYFKLRENEDMCEKIFKEFNLDSKDAHIINGHVPVESKNGESPIKANGKILVIDGGFSRAYQNKTGIAGYTLISNSYSLQLVSHNPFTSAEEAIINESDILSTTEVVEHKAKRKTVRDTDAGIKLEEEVEDLKLLLMAYKKGLIKET